MELTLPVDDHRLPHSLLPQQELYFCPGESSPVSQSVHLGRLAAGWPGCDRCPRRVTDGEANHRARLAPVRAVTARVATTPATRIRRTAFGVRGEYLNQIDRTCAAQFAAIFSTHLTALQMDAVTHDLDDEPLVRHEIRSRAAGQISIVAGLDGRRHSPDIFAGVVSAIVQNGCHVIDIGRCSTASLQECVRSLPNACAALMVTGAGCSTGHTGLDVFDRCGETVCVPWQRFGVTVQPARDLQPAERHSSDASEQLHSVPIHNVLQRFRSADIDADRDSAEPDSDVLRVPETVLTLPALRAGPGGIFRSVRRSGCHRSVDFEPHHRKWLQQWFPDHVSRRTVVFAEDSLSAARVRSVVEKTDKESNLIAGELASTDPAAIQQAVADAMTRFGAEAAFIIGEDDRFLSVFNRSSRVLTPAELTNWLNRTVRSSAAHVTAHVAEDAQRVLLLDAGRPHSGDSHETISDALALTGLILNMLNHRSNSLPV